MKLFPRFCSKYLIIYSRFWKYLDRLFFRPDLFVFLIIIWNNINNKEILTFTQKCILDTSLLNPNYNPFTVGLYFVYTTYYCVHIGYGKLFFLTNSFASFVTVYTVHKFTYNIGSLVGRVPRILKVLYCSVKYAMLRYVCNICIIRYDSYKDIFLN